jgi:hypothetical protein
MGWFYPELILVDKDVQDKVLNLLWIHLIPPHIILQIDCRLLILISCLVLIQPLIAEHLRVRKGACPR